MAKGTNKSFTLNMFISPPLTLGSPQVGYSAEGGAPPSAEYTYIYIYIYIYAGGSSEDKCTMSREVEPVRGSSAGAEVARLRKWHCRGGCSGWRVQWMGVVLHSKTAYNIM